MDVTPVFGSKNLNFDDIHVIREHAVIAACSYM